jgi:hypothetical protein
MAEKNNSEFTTTPELHEAGGNEPQTAPTPKPKGIRWTQVMLTAVGLVALGAGISAVFWYVSNIEPALHPVKGYVFLDGEPMDGGAIILQHAGGWPGALGAIEKDGSFELTTNGALGAYEGTNLVSFTLMDGGFPPTSLLPAKYVDPNNPPFTIEVDASTKEQDLRFDLVGKLKKD